MKISFATAAIALGSLTAAAAHAQTYSAIYAFGDSLSDAGNLFISDGGTEPVAPYSDGRYTNGNTWVQDLSLALGNGPLTASLAGGTDFAYAGARTGTTLVGPAAPIDLPSQLAQFNTATGGVAPSTALYTLDIGANDLRGALLASLTPSQDVQVAQQAAANAASFAASLESEGARQLLLFNVPDLGVIPEITALGPTAEAAASSLAQTFNADLLADLLPVEEAGLHVTVLDEYTQLDAIVGDPSAYGFTNVTNPCWTGTATSSTSGTLCSPTMAGQDQYFFWDDVHPTAAGHQLIADNALALLAPVAVPEPGMLSLLGIGLLGAGLVGWRRRR